MKTWLLALLLVVTGGLPGWRWLVRVRDYNEAQARGQAAASRGQASEAAYYFGQAVALSGRGGPAPALLLALAQAQARAGQAGPAQATYGQLLGAAVPATVGSAARQQLAVLLTRKGQPAQALGLLRQSLRLNPNNLAARYDYEVLGRYLAGRPTPPPPPDSAATPPKQPPKAKPRPDSAASGGQQPRQQAGGGQGRPTAAPQPHPGTEGAAPAPTSPSQPSQPGPAPTGSGAGGTASGGRRPGSGPAQSLPAGSQPGAQRGLSPGGSGTGGRPGPEAATDADAQLQTQRERLRAMSLTPAQAQQLLDALRASEQQYLQQRPHARRGPAPTPGQPTW